MNIPQLFVFAGPNGAGKSTLSATMLAEATPIFDGDKEFAKLKKTFEATDSGTLYNAVNGHIFDDWKNEQLSAKRDCAFETNFRSAEVMDTVNMFKQQGYQTTLIYFGLPEVKDAIERVNCA
jgi:predicted ABC-type ATPase